jgi:site-specific recombinase XerD
VSRKQILRSTQDDNPLRVLAERFLAMLRDERGAGEHTLRAYSREVRGFAAFLAERLGEDAAIASVEHTDIRAYMGVLYDKGLGRRAWRGRWRRCGAGLSGWRRRGWWSRIRRCW